MGLQLPGAGMGGTWGCFCTRLVSLILGVVGHPRGLSKCDVKTQWGFADTGFGPVQFSYIIKGRHVNHVEGRELEKQENTKDQMSFCFPAPQSVVRRLAPAEPRAGWKSRPSVPPGPWVRSALHTFPSEAEGCSLQNSPLCWSRSLRAS